MAYPKQSCRLFTSSKFYVCQFSVLVAAYFIILLPTPFAMLARKLAVKTRKVFTSWLVLLHYAGSSGDGCKEMGVEPDICHVQTEYSAI